jgi:hypothetical protein
MYVYPGILRENLKKIGDLKDRGHGLGSSG